MVKLKDYTHKDVMEDDIQGIHDFIKSADIVRARCRGLAAPSAQGEAASVVDALSDQAKRKKPRRKRQIAGRPC